MADYPTDGCIMCRAPTKYTLAFLDVISVPCCLHDTCLTPAVDLLAERVRQLLLENKDA